MVPDDPWGPGEVPAEPEADGEAPDVGEEEAGSAVPAVAVAAGPRPAAAPVPAADGWFEGRSAGSAESVPTVASSAQATPRRTEPRRRRYQGVATGTESAS